MSHIYHLTSCLPTATLENMAVLLRADLNVPLDQTTILSDFRLKALEPTLALLIQKKACVLLVTHIGRPHDQDPLLSTKRLVPWFSEHGYNIFHAQTIDQAAKLLQPAHIVLLENIRFWPEEKAGGSSLAHKLRSITTYFVQDAFGTLHRTDTTITLLAQLYAENQRTIGLVVERELNALNRLLQNHNQSGLAIIGGAKIATKLPLIHNLLNLTDTIALLPPLSLMFAYARNLPVGSALIDKVHTGMTRTILKHAHAHPNHLIFPVDYLVSTNGWSGPYLTINATDLRPDHMVITIGQRTQVLIQQHIMQAHTIIFNGPSGDLVYPRTIQAMKTLFESFCKSNAYKVVAGGDSLALLEHFKLTSCVSYCSTGGGASIAYLSGQQLAGLQVFVTS